MSASGVSSVRVVVMPAWTRRATETQRPGSRALPKDPRQSEVREEAAAAKPGDGRYAVALQSEDEERVRPRDVRLGTREIAAERRLRVGARGHEQWRATPGGAIAQERADRGTALVFVGLGGHRQPGIVGEQRDDAVDVTRLDRVGKATDDVALEF